MGGCKKDGKGGGKNWIAGAIKKPGALHEALGVPKGKKIPSSLMTKKPGDSILMKRRKNLANTLNGFKK